MTKTLIKNVDVLALDATGDVLRSTNIAIDGRLILAVVRVPDGFTPDDTIDGYNRVAMPGFFNAHCHTPMTYERGWAEDLPFPRWLNEKIWVAESALTADEVYWGPAPSATPSRPRRQSRPCGEVGRCQPHHGRRPPFVSAR